MKKTGKYSKYAPYVAYLRRAVDAQEVYDRLEERVMSLMRSRTNFISLHFYKTKKKMRRLFAALFLLIPLCVNAQDGPLITPSDSVSTLVDRVLSARGADPSYKIRKIKSHINLEFAATANAYITDGQFDEASFKMNRVRLEILGRLNSHLSYHFRQSFNKYSNPFSVDNMSSSIEYAYIKWHQSDKFNLTAGKQYLHVGGYEGFVNGLLVREFSDFNNNFEIYQTGLKASVFMSPTQHLMIQLTNNRSNSDAQTYIHGLPAGLESSKLPLLGTLNWTGWFFDEALNLMYSASAGQLAKGKNIYYLMCGNIYEKGPVLAYVDVLYQRSGVDTQQRITTLQNIPGSVPVTAQNTQYFTVIANMDYKFHPKWNGYIKGAYETAGIYESNGIFDKGRYINSWNAQACIEWFPFVEDSGFKVFAHYVYKGYNLTDKAKALGAAMPHIQRISLGIQYIIPVL